MKCWNPLQRIEGGHHGFFQTPRAFDPLDLEIIDRVYEGAWAKLEACEPFRDRERDLERQEALRKQMACATAGHVDFDDLWRKCWQLLLTQSPSPPKRAGPYDRSHGPL